MSNLKANTKIMKVFTTIASIIVISIMLFTIIGIFGYEKSYATDTTNNDVKWSITIGNKTVLHVDSLQEGTAVINGLKKSYVSKGYTLMSATISPVIKVVKYVPENTTARSVSSVKSVSVNDAIKYIKDNKLVTVKTVQRVKTTKSIDYKTVYKKSSKIRKTTSRVSRKGVKGTKQFVTEITNVNGENTNSELISTSTVKAAKSKTVLKGTGYVRARKGKTISGTTGADVVSYAKKFVGNRYVYGGTSLTRGCDCSGFVQSVYKHFGVKVPRTLQTSIGKRVSVRSLKKGDIVRYNSYGHMAIYIGNGKVVHALNERVGIVITKIGYAGRVIQASRVFR